MNNIEKNYYTSKISSKIDMLGENIQITQIFGSF